MALSTTFDSTTKDGDTVVVTLIALGADKGHIGIDTFSKPAPSKPSTKTRQDFDIGKLSCNAARTRLTAHYRPFIFVDIPILVTIDKAAHTLTLRVGSATDKDTVYQLSDAEVAGLDKFLADAMLPVA